ncbi:hypothetical protein CCACVL1_19842 [Corchorus capsularis]|uniref:CCHC-type domain-containing protein n=1 Tax=Corchorus capsularis TaxID=210143 RepID=A0A1R3HEP6_COCAP|nr:hypothetical protein CCACVL1_19842 [Corchorus capsularis]
MDLEIELETGEAESLVWSKHMAIGKIHAIKILNRKGVVAILRSIWTDDVASGIKEVGDNIYGISFSSESTRDRAIGEGPWSVMGYHLNLKKWEGDQTVNEIDFHELDFWLQVHNLPPDMLTNKNARAISKVLGTVVKIDETDFNNGFGNGFLRLHVGIEVVNPLICGFWVPRRGRCKVWANVKYERLADFCYSCGKFGHMAKHCLVDAKVSLDGKPLYGPHLRASSVRSDIGRKDPGAGKWNKWNSGEMALLITDAENKVEDEAREKWGKQWDVKKWNENNDMEMMVDNTERDRKGKRHVEEPKFHTQNNRSTFSSPMIDMNIDTPVDTPVNIPKTNIALQSHSIQNDSLIPIPDLGDSTLDISFVNKIPKPVFSPVDIPNSTIVPKIPHPSVNIISTVPDLTNGAIIPLIQDPVNNNPPIQSPTLSSSDDGDPGPLLLLSGDTHNTSPYPVMPGGYQYPDLVNIVNDGREIAYEWDSNSKDIGIMQDSEEVSSVYKVLDNEEGIEDVPWCGVKNVNNEAAGFDMSVKQKPGLIETSLAAELRCLKLKRGADGNIVEENEISLEKRRKVTAENI